jgi:hypothetical protein
LVYSPPLPPRPRRPHPCPAQIANLGSKYADAAKAYFEKNQGKFVGAARDAAVAGLRTVFKPQEVCVDVIKFTDDTCKRWSPSVQVCWPNGVSCNCCSCRKKVFGRCVFWNPPDCQTNWACRMTQPVCVEWKPVKVCKCVLNCW